jgi:protein-tyrosine phosphatase
MTSTAEHADPARIRPHADPRTRHMSGFTAHGYVPFDVPFISEIVPGLWQGGVENGLILPDFIRHHVSLYSPEKYRIRHKLASTLEVRMTDGTGEDMSQVPAIAAWVNACRADGPALVSCQAGLNRSGLIVATALMLGGMTADSAIALLREKRSPACLCNPAFEEWLRDRDNTTSGLLAPLASLWPGGSPRYGPIAVRACNTLMRAGLKTVGEVAACTEDDLLGIRNFAHGQLREVQRVLADAGLSLAGDPGRHQGGTP